MEKGWCDVSKTKTGFWLSETGGLFGYIFHMDTQEGGIIYISLLVDNEAEKCQIDQFFQMILSPEICKTKISLSAPSLILSVHTRNHELYALKMLVELAAGTHKEDKTYSSYHHTEAPHSLEEYNIIDVSLPEGYRIGKLSAQHEDHIVKYWSADLIGVEAVNPKSWYLYPVVKDNIAFRPTVALFFKEEPDPVGWITLYENGTMGMLHVIEGHRRKGLASVLLKTMMRRIIEECGAPVSASVSPSNGTTYDASSNRHKI